jgi:hypothetical protein
VTSHRTVAKYLNEDREIVSCARSQRGSHELMGGRLRSFGFPLEMRIGHDGPTFNTAHLAGPLLLLRDTVGDQTSMCTSAGRAHWERLWGLFGSLRFTVHIWDARSYCDGFALS